MARTIAGEEREPNEGSLPYYRGGSRPVPDPTVLTTQQLFQAIASLKELFEVRVHSIEENIKLIQSDLDQRSKETREQVKHLELLHNEKFKRIDTQILERDGQTDKASRDVKSAVEQAFLAAKQAVDQQNNTNALSIAKSDATISKQIDGITETMKSNTKTTDDKINDLKDRVTIVESLKKGGSDVISYVFAAFAAAASLVAVFAFMK